MRASRGRATSGWGDEAVVDPDTCTEEAGECAGCVAVWPGGREPPRRAALRVGRRAWKAILAGITWWAERLRNALVMANTSRGGGRDQNVPTLHLRGALSTGTSMAFRRLSAVVLHRCREGIVPGLPLDGCFFRRFDEQKSSDPVNQDVVLPTLGSPLSMHEAGYKGRSGSRTPWYWPLGTFCFIKCDQSLTPMQ